MVDVNELIGVWIKVKDALDEAARIGDNGVMLSVLCTAIDYCAMKTEQESVELMDGLRPYIEACNKEFGGMKE